jgi:hypothetical protein
MVSLAGLVSKISIAWMAASRLGASSYLDALVFHVIVLSKVGLLGIDYQSIDNALALAKPFLAVLGRIVQIFITGYTKNTALFKLENASLRQDFKHEMKKGSKHNSRDEKDQSFIPSLQEG